MNIDKSPFAHCMLVTATLANSRHASLHPTQRQEVFKEEGKVLQLQKYVQARQVSPCFESFQKTLQRWVLVSKISRREIWRRLR